MMEAALPLETYNQADPVLPAMRQKQHVGTHTSSEILTRQRAGPSHLQQKLQYLLKNNSWHATEPL